MKEFTDLFGNKVRVIEPTKKREKTLFDDYEGFTKKFEPKKTTDDCYTPDNVYECVLEYVIEKFELRDREIVRPFYPGGDYERCEYPDGCVVVDNPPFSILSKIIKFYQKEGVKFFLFAPHLTLFGSASRSDYTQVVVGGNIIYENKANVKTSFVTNLYEDDTIVDSWPDLYRRLEEVQKRPTVHVPVYKYPIHVLTVSALQWCTEKGVGAKFRKDELVYIRRLDSQKGYGKAIFGSGYLLSDEAAARLAAARLEAARLAAARLEAARLEAARLEAARLEAAIEWKLSEREKRIIEEMNGCKTPIKR